jgi:hypothetical protein
LRRYREPSARGIDAAISSSSKSVSAAANTVQQSAAGIKEIVSSSGKSISEAADSIKTAAQEVVPEVHGVRLMAKSLCMSVATIAVIMEQMLLEIKQVNQNLENIREELWRINVLTSSGGAGKSGFAEVVYNFVDMEAGRGQYKDDCFFIWHPDTSWHPAFYAKVKETPLPSTFIGESDSLDQLCIAMKAIRKGMREQGKKKMPTFHILISSWYNIAVMEPLHFPDKLLPLRLVGPKHDGGKPLVSFVLPRPQAELTVQAVGNNYEEKVFSPDMKMGVAVATTASSWMAYVGTVVAVAGTATSVVLASPVAMPALVGTYYATVLAGKAAGERLADILCDTRPRVLGSHSRLRDEDE